LVEMSGACQRDLLIGLDVGSISLNTVLMTPDGAILEDHYTRIHGKPLETVLEVLRGVLERWTPEKIKGIGVTGVAGKLVAQLLGGIFLNEVIAQARSVQLLAPQTRTIVEMGGQDAKLILLSPYQGNGRLQIEDFSMNSLCAAGTGSFLDQQASRLGLTIEEFGQMALRSAAPPRIAGRCSVFAKSDMIHLQQAATPDYDIVAGLCFAVARNFKGSVARGKPLRPPVSFQGGVAANPGMVRAFREVLELQEEDFLVPAHFASTGAIGAILMLLDDPSLARPFEGLQPLERYLGEHREEPRARSLGALARPAHVRKGATPVHRPAQASERVRAFLGVDVGSISTNVVVIDEQGRVLSKRYLMTAGRPLEAVKQGLREVGQEVGERVVISGAGTTGSGRYLTGDFIGADVIRNEITAQATAAVAIDPQVDTIFEIGGQDSKYISLSNGAVVDFAMNKVCAAGTGSFLEEQAERLGISIQEEFAELAFSSRAPLPLGERCTVFMESDLVHHLQRGAPIPDLVAGLAYSIVENYLNKVVETRRVGRKIFFQGGPAFNHAIVAAFERVLGKPVTVPPHHEVTGAIGAALLAMRENPKPYSDFKGFELGERAYQISPFECKACPNRCEIKKVIVSGEEDRPLFYGGRCERYERRRVSQESTQVEIPDLFARRERTLLETHPDEGPDGGPRVGIPRTLFFLELLPFWKAFFSSMGFRVVISDPTNKEVIHRGVEKVVAETCFPIKVAFGHVENLIQKGVDLIFLPSLIDMGQAREDLPQGFNCPYVQTIPYTVRSAFDFEALGIRLLDPPLRFGAPRQEIHKALIQLGRSLGVSRARVRGAIQAAQEAQGRFSLAMRQMGQEALGGLKAGDRAMVIVSRVYNGCDSGVNLNLPRKLRDLGVMAIPLDAIPLEGVEPDEEVLGHYWRYGQRFMAAAKLLRQDPRLYPIYITNFGCGPDSFITHFFRNAMGEKPILQIEIDEHSSDVGAITRLEAFLDSLRNAPDRASGPLRPIRRQGLHSIGRERTVFLPYMTDQARAVAAAFEASGVPARVLPRTTEETLRVGRRYTSGKECYPAILTTGDMLAWAMRPGFDRARSAFFMPGGSGPCRFGQYNRFHRLVLDQAGFDDVPIYSPVQDQEMYKQLGLIGKTFVRLGWRGVVAIDFLEKALWEVRPVESQAGEAQRVYQEAVERVCEQLREGNGDLFPILQEARRAFEAIPRHSGDGRPLVGIVGEIYIRSNPFANENVIRQLEQLGVTVWMPPISEWLLYINCISKRHAIRDRRWKNYLRTSIKEWFQRRDEHRMEEIFHGLVRNLHEPTIEETMSLAGPYVHSSFEGETILSIGKAEDFYRKGVSGIVSVGPFTCMPGTIVTALLKRFREEHRDIPVLNLFFDGQADSSTQNRLEAFVHQVQGFKDRKQTRG
jgi:predicted CoA-substrate-specific enzyme activase